MHVHVHVNVNRCTITSSHSYLPADRTLDGPVDVRAVYATRAKGVEAGEQAGLVVIFVADAAGEWIPGPAARHARRAVVADPVDRRARARHCLRRRRTGHPERRSTPRARIRAFCPSFTTPLPVPCSRVPLRNKNKSRFIQTGTAREFHSDA